MVQGGGVPSWQRAGPESVASGASEVSVLPVVVQPLITHTAIKKPTIRFIIHPWRLPTSAANSSSSTTSSMDASVD